MARLNGKGRIGFTVDKVSDVSTLEVESADACFGMCVEMGDGCAAVVFNKNDTKCWIKHWTRDGRNGLFIHANAEVESAVKCSRAVLLHLPNKSFNLI